MLCCTILTFILLSSLVFPRKRTPAIKYIIIMIIRTIPRKYLFIFIFLNNFSLRNLYISCTASSSNAFVGSSSNIIFWFSKIACAIFNRCFIPNENFFTFLSESGSRPTLSREKIISFSSAIFFIFASIWRFLFAEHSGSNSIFSITIPVSGGNSILSCSFSPSMKILPLSRFIKPLIALSSIVFPEPFCPYKP